MIVVVVVVVKGLWRRNMAIGHRRTSVMLDKDTVVKPCMDV